MTLGAHNIKSAVGSRRSAKKIGRGNASGHGSYSTRGGKGQTARSGGSRGLNRLGFKFQLQSTPKLRGFTSHFREVAEVYLSDLDKKYEAGETVNLIGLKEKKIIPATAKSAKVLSKGTLTKKLVIEGIKLSKGAAAAVTAVGGEIK